MGTAIIEFIVYVFGPSFLLFCVTPSWWIDREPLTWWMRLWGVFLTPFLSLIHPVLKATARNEYEEKRQVEAYWGYIRKVWLGGYGEV